MKYPAPIPKQFVDQSGLPLSNGTVHVYISGDTQYANVYQDADGEELMPNPAKLDSNGAWVGFVTAGVPLDYVVEDKEGNVQFEYEKVVAAQGGSGSQVAIEPVLTSGTKIAECWVDGELLELFAPEGGGGSQVQSNWNESDTTSPAYIKNKPSIPSLSLFQHSQRVSIDVGAATSKRYNLNAFVPAGKRFVGTLTLSNMHTSQNSGAYQYTLDVPGASMTCIFGTYPEIPQSGHTIGMSVNNPGDTQFQLYFKLSGMFESQDVDIYINGIVF